MFRATSKIGDFQFPSVGYGAMGLSGWYGDVGSQEERFKLLDAVFASGTTFWDTADVYLDSEDLIGAWFKRTGKRNYIFLATKFGFTADFSINGTATYVREAAEKSLKRLGVDTIDLYYLHRPDQKTPIEVTVKAMAELVKEGKVKYIGLSECSAATLRRAHAVHPITAIQMEYSVFALDIEDDKIALMKTARELGIKIVAYSPLGRGLITGRYKSVDDFEENDSRRHMPRFGAESFPRILELARSLNAIGQNHGVTGGQVALAWLIAQGKNSDVIVIPGTKNIKYMEENVAAGTLKLSEEDLKEVRELAKRADSSWSGLPRYGPGMEEQLFADTPEYVDE